MNETGIDFECIVHNQKERFIKFFKGHLRIGKSCEALGFNKIILLFELILGLIVFSFPISKFLAAAVDL